MVFGFGKKDKISVNRQEYESLRQRDKRATELETSFSSVMELIGQVLTHARNVRTREDVIRARAEANSSANRALEEWKKCELVPLENLIKKFRGLSASVAANAIMETDLRSNKIPWVWYDFINKNLYYGPAASDFLNMKQNGRDSGLYLMDLLSYIGDEDRKGIVNSLDSGKGLRHYKAFTSQKYSKKPKELWLSTYPVFYLEESRKSTREKAELEKKPAGVAIFLRDPCIYWHSRGCRRFAEEIQNSIESILKLFEKTILSYIPRV